MLQRILRGSVRALLVAATVAATHPAPVVAQADHAEYRGAAALGLALRRVGTTKRMLMIGAHPDDENTQLLAALALEQGAETAYLSLTRGEGGQNGVGPELGEALGVLRTEELLAARRLDGAEQFFSRAYDFGFSKSADEAFRHWPREALLADVVRTIRRFRPDVVVSIFAGTPADGHGQHQVAGLLAREAFRAAADPARFPEQIRAGLRPWQPRKLYQSLWRTPELATLRVPVGERDPLLGRSPFQIAMASRGRHRSQDMGQPEPAGPRWAYLRRLDAVGQVPPAEAERSLWAGIDTTLAKWAPRAATSSLREFGADAARLRGELNPLAPGELVPGLAAEVERLRRAEGQFADVASPEAEELRFRLGAEAENARAALVLAAGVVLDAVADDGAVAPGEEFGLAVSLWNGGERSLAVRTLAPDLPPGWTSTPLDPLPALLAPGTLLERRFRVRVPADAEPTGPYFLRRPRNGDLYRWPDDSDAGLPFGRDPVRVRAELEAAGVVLPLAADATLREVDPRQGELRRPVRVISAVSVALAPGATVLRTGAPAPLRFAVRLRAEQPGGTAGTVRLVLPAGWRSEPASLPVRFAGPGEEREAAFTVRPPAGVAEGSYRVAAIFRGANGAEQRAGASLVEYPHVRARTLPDSAVAEVRAFEVRVPRGLRVGYVTGAGDPGPGVLAPLGITATPLDAVALESGDLDRFNVIVTGPRAYEVRPDLAAANPRLLEWVRRGGTLLVQYNKYEFAEGGFAPFPLRFAEPHDRVVDETAPVRLLEPDHPALRGPNRITARDFAGWVQERGLYFPHEWDSRYTPLLEMADPSEAPLRGALLVAPYGRGRYIYTGLAFFRQLPAGVPGAFRLFANLLALGADR